MCNVKRAGKRRLLLLIGARLLKRYEGVRVIEEMGANGRCHHGRSRNVRGGRRHAQGKSKSLKPGWDRGQEGYREGEGRLPRSEEQWDKG